MGMTNYLSQIVGARECPEQPQRMGLGSWSYPWAHMEPGHVFAIPDPSRRARSALTAAAAGCTRRTGARFATGADFDDDRNHVGWWCARIDGCEILPPPPTWKQRDAAEDREKRREARRRQRAASGQTKRALRKKKIEPVRPLVVATEWSQAPAAASEYAGWDKPREPGEVF